MKKEHLTLNGRYRLEESFSGGMAMLWKAWDTYRDTWVAVKVLHERNELVRLHETTDGQALESDLATRFRRECAILREIRHPAIPAWLDEGFHDGRPYLVMGWVEGMTLHQFIENYGQCETSVVASLVVQMAAALDYAHRCGFIHRDLNPKNVMITREGVVHLVDFGIAMPLDPTVTRYTAYGTRSPGTPGYTSPEQHNGGAVGVPSDIYSLGCVAFELHTGRWPFHPDSERDLERQHESDKPAPPVAWFAPGLPPELAETVDRMLIKPIRHRLDSVPKILAVYRAFLPSTGDPEPSPRMTHDPTRPFRRPEPEARTPRGRSAAPRRVRPAHRDSSWLQPAAAAAALEAARNELRDGHAAPGPHCEALERIRKDALRSWGIRAEATARIQLVCADARFAGAESSADTETALRLYRELVVELAQHAAPGIREVFLSARAGASSCLLALARDPAPAFDGWVAVTSETAELPEPPEDTLRRCRVLGEEFLHLGFRADRVRALLAGLSTT
ncbi:serine/threonine protein kinase [Streptomyces sp. NPDC094448]|uniref:serine/threonine protein kinase n=1 Tax=Streptomyces sp. NPDC094448 TaxID=3366063 RepID=UPI00381E0145